MLCRPALLFFLAAGVVVLGGSFGLALGRHFAFGGLFLVFLDRRARQRDRHHGDFLGILFGVEQIDDRNSLWQRQLAQINGFVDVQLGHVDFNVLRQIARQALDFNFRDDALANAFLCLVPEIGRAPWR